MKDFYAHEGVENLEGFGKVAFIIKRYYKICRKWICILLLVGLIILLWQLSRARNLNKELEDQKKAVEEQLDRQWQVIEGLRKKQEESGSLVQDSAPIVTSDQLKAELNSIQELVTQQYIYTNADRFEQNQTWLFGWDMPLSDKSLLATYDGIIKAGIDLSDISVDVDEETRSITITLPPSKITDNNIPQETISVVEAKDGLFNKVTFDDYNKFISDQKIVMENKAIERGLLTNADKVAQSIIENFLSKIPGIENYSLQIVHTE